MYTIINIIDFFILNDCDLGKAQVAASSQQQLNKRDRKQKGEIENFSQNGFVKIQYLLFELI